MQVFSRVAGRDWRYLCTNVESKKNYVSKVYLKNQLKIFWLIFEFKEINLESAQSASGTVVVVV